MMNTHSGLVQETKSQQTENAAAHNQSGNKTFLPFVDNRPEAIQLRKFQAMANQKPARNFNGSSSKHPVQRLIIGVGDVKQMDLAIAIDLVFHKQYVTGEIISFEDLKAAEPGTVSIADGEIIVITGHGAPGVIDETYGHELALQLCRIKNYKKAKAIFISSCDAATPTGKDTKDSLVDVTHEFLKSSEENEKQIPIYGTVGHSMGTFGNSIGDARIRFNKGFDKIVNILSRLILSSEHAKVRTELDLDKINTVYQYGTIWVNVAKHHQYDAFLLKALSGQLTMNEAIVITNRLIDTIDAHLKIAREFNKIATAAPSAAAAPSPSNSPAAAAASPDSGAATAAAHSGAAAPAAGAAAAPTPAPVAISKEELIAAIDSFIKEAKLLIHFIHQNYILKNTVSAVAEAQKGESTINGYDAAGNESATTYLKLIKPTDTGVQS